MHAGARASRAAGRRRRPRAPVGAVTACLILLSGGPVWSQAAASTAAPPAAAPSASLPVPPAPGASYHYDPSGRRDPFVSLVGQGAEARSEKHIEGLPGLTALEVKVSGIIESHGEYVAMVQGPEGKTWLAHVHDRLRDGTITSITLREVVIEQAIADPLSPVRQREIRKSVGGATK